MSDLPDINKFNGIKIDNEIIDKRYIVLSQREDYVKNCLVLKVFDIDEQVYKTLDVPNEYFV